MSTAVDPLVERVARRHLAVAGESLSPDIRGDILRVRDGVVEVVRLLRHLNDEQERLADLTREYLLLLDSGEEPSGRAEGLAEAILGALAAVTGAAIRLVPALAAARDSIRLQTQTPLPDRMAGRQAAVVLRDVPRTETSISYTNSGRISAREVERVLKTKLGMLSSLTFVPSMIGTPNTVAWVALNVDAEIVTGKLVLHAGMREGEVLSWAEIIVDADELEDERSIIGAVDPIVRLRHVERLLEALLGRIKQDPKISVVDLVGGLVEIAGEARISP